MKCEVKKHIDTCCRSLKMASQTSENNDTEFEENEEPIEEREKPNEKKRRKFFAKEFRQNLLTKNANEGKYYM